MSYPVKKQHLVFRFELNEILPKIKKYSSNNCVQFSKKLWSKRLKIFPTVPQSLIDILLGFSAKFLKFVFKDLLRVSIKLQLKFDQISILVYLKILLRFSKVFSTFFRKLVVSNFFCLNFVLCFIKLFAKISDFQNFVPKFY